MEILKRSAIQLISPLTWPASWSSIFFNVFQYLFLQFFYLKHQIYLLTNQIVWLQHQVNFWRPHTDWITRWYMGPGFGFWNKALRWHPLPCSDDHHQKIIWISNELLTSFHWLNYKIMDWGFWLSRPKVALWWQPLPSSSLDHKII